MIYVNTGVPIRSDFVPEGPLAMLGDILAVTMWRVVLLASSQVVARGVEHPVRHRTAPATKNYLAQNFNSAMKTLF